MTIRHIFLALLIELSKVKAPSLLLLDFNYFLNKAIILYVNKKYTLYNINLQTTDDLRVLESSAELTPQQLGDDSVYSKLSKSIYEIFFPNDYLHLLNCICIYRVAKPYKCYNIDLYVSYPATKLTSDSLNMVMLNYYTKPTPERPYYYINNSKYSNKSTCLVSNEIIDEEVNTGKNILLNNKFNLIKISKGYSLPSNLFLELQPILNLKESYNKYYLEYKKFSDIDYFEIHSLQNNQTLGVFNYLNSKLNIHTNTLNSGNLPIKLNDFTIKKIKLVNNLNKCEIRIGQNNPALELVKVLITYIKIPKNVELTLDLLDLIEDTSENLEFPKYVCQEIINELVHIVMENTQDTRLQTHIPISLSIATQVQQN